ncbi:MAG: hypothetical protein RL244_1737 [Pseudomonadota bacterium]|jgi:general secretion pathway protein I
MKNRLNRRTEARQAGFTLIEVLVALAIVAIALVAGSQATQALVRHGERQSDMLLAQICAENQLVAMRLSQVFPPVGDSEVSCPQAGVDLTVRITVMPTPNPNFRRVDAHTHKGALPLFRLSTIMGRL